MSITKITCLFMLASFFGSECFAEEAKDKEFYPEVVFTSGDGAYDIEDGDSFWLWIHRLRLFGIDTIEADQQCFRDGENGDCHRKTINFLESQLSRGDLRCRMHTGKGGHPHMFANRYTVTCYVGGRELNRLMVEEGWAVAAKGRDGVFYRESEAEARRARKGIHAYQFDHPKDHRNADEVEADVTSLCATAIQVCRAPATD